MSPAADWQSHHIEGYARAMQERGGGTGYFSAPLISHVRDNLWQGGCIDGVRLDDDFRYVVSLYPWERYLLGPETTRTEIEMYDAGELPALECLNEAIDAVIFGMKRGKTLVHCQAGLNRSGLVAALAMVNAWGMSGAEAIDLLRESRSPMVLCNEAFEAHVRGF